MTNLDSTQQDPRHTQREEGYPATSLDQPAKTGDTTPEPDHGEQTYRGTGKLSGKVALITGGDSGIGRAVAIAYAREGADVAIAYLDEEQADAETTAHWIEEAGQRALLIPGECPHRGAVRL